MFVRWGGGAAGRGVGNNAKTSKILNPSVLKAFGEGKLGSGQVSPMLVPSCNLPVIWQPLAGGNANLMLYQKGPKQTAQKTTT